MNFKDYYCKEIMNESSYSRLMNMIVGLIPKVREFGIITWENPHSKKLSTEENNSRNEELKEILQGLNYGYVQIIGKYGNIENPFFVPNIIREDIFKLGLEGEQDSVIHGKIIKEFDVSYEMIYMDGRESLFRRILRTIKGGKVVWNQSKDERFMSKLGDKVSDNYYSEYKGKRFIIPFYDDKAENAFFTRLKKDNGQLTGVGIKESFRIYFKEDFKEEFVSNIEEIFEENDIMKQRGKIHQWDARGQIYYYLLKESIEPGKINIRKKEIL